MKHRSSKIIGVTIITVLSACPPGNPEVPEVPLRCQHAFRMTGDSQENARLLDSNGQPVDLIHVAGDPATCPDGVGIIVRHEDPGARLMGPQEVCVDLTSEENVSEVWFRHRLGCECAAPWEWIATDKAPPVKFKVVIRPVGQCGG